MIKIDRLTKTYPAAPRPILDGVSFSVDAGEVLWISGRSGVGKSTLLNLLGLLSVADSGSYVLNGVDLVGASAAVRRTARRDHISTIFQRGNLFPHLSALDNIAVGMRSADAGEAEAQLDAVGLSSKATQLAGLLSGGEQQRVAIARAAARRTPVLLADEPISGLDDGNAWSVLNLLRDSAARGATVVVVSHDRRAGDIASDHFDLGQVAA